MKHGSLFSGIGGFDLAAEWVGWENVFQVENDKYCNKVLEKNFPHTIRFSNIFNLTVDNYGNLLYLCENGDIIMNTKKSKKYDNAVSLYEAGMSLGECAEFYEISRQAIHMILRRRNCEFRSNLKYGSDNHFHRGCLVDKTKQKRACHLVEMAIEKGVLIRPVLCGKCDNTQIFKNGANGIQAHHCDYDKPLEVEWLCQKCHHKWHKTNTVLNETDKEKTGNPPGAVDIISGGFP